MEDLEKELGPLIDNYVKKYEGSKVKKREQLNENEEFKNRFTQIGRKYYHAADEQILYIV